MNCAVPTQAFLMNASIQSFRSTVFCQSCPRFCWQWLVFRRISLLCQYYYFFSTLAPRSTTRGHFKSSPLLHGNNLCFVLLSLQPIAWRVCDVGCERDYCMTFQCSQVFGLLLLLCCWPLLTTILKAEKISYSFIKNSFSVSDNKKKRAICSL